MTPEEITGYLANLFYEIDKQQTPDQRVAPSFKDKEGNSIFGKWLSFMKLDPQDEKTIRTIAHRGQLNSEIILELDPDEDIKGTSEALKQFDQLLDQLEKDGIRYRAFCTEEGRGMHIETFWDKLALMKKEDRKNIRLFLINKYGCDTMLSSDEHQVSFGTHFKTDKEKVLYRTNWKGNPYQAERNEVLNLISSIQDEYETYTQKEEISKHLPQGFEIEEILSILKDVDEKKVIHIDGTDNTDRLKQVSRAIQQLTGKLIFLINNNFEKKGKIVNKVFEYPEKISIIKYAETYKDKIETQQLFFLDDHCDRRNWNVTDNLDDEFFVYRFISHGRQYHIFSKEEIDLADYQISGSLFEIEDRADIGHNASIGTKIPIVFLKEALPRIIQFKDHDEFINFFKELNLTEDLFFNYLFAKYKEDFHDKAKDVGFSFRHPDYFEKLMGSFVLSANVGGWPLHLMIIAVQGTGKTTIEEAIHSKFMEDQAIVEGSNYTLKGLTPSFKGNIAEVGALIKSNRISTIDEFLRILTRVKPEDREVALGAFNPLLEHSYREFGSGNCRVKTKMTAKTLSVSNGVYGMKDMLSLSQKLDGAFLSRWLIVFQDKEHVDFIQKRKGKEEIKIKIDHNDFLSIVDYLQSFESKVDSEKISKIFNVYRDKFPESIQETYDARYLHHLECLLDGIIKIRCVFEEDTSFEAKDSDYETAKQIWQRIIRGWNIVEMYQKMQEDMIEVLSAPQKFIIETLLQNERKIRDSALYDLDIQDPVFHMVLLEQLNVVYRDGHYWRLQTSLTEYFEREIFGGQK